MTSKRLVRLRELASQHPSASFVVNVSHVEVFFGDPHAAQTYIRDVRTEFGRSVRIEHEDVNGAVRLRLSLGPDTREPKPRRS